MKPVIRQGDTPQESGGEVQDGRCCAWGSMQALWIPSPWVIL